jgi:hypothetical protein
MAAASRWATEALAEGFPPSPLIVQIFLSTSAFYSNTDPYLYQLMRSLLALRAGLAITLAGGFA